MLSALNVDNRRRTVMVKVVFLITNTSITLKFGYYVNMSETGIRFTKNIENKDYTLISVRVRTLHCPLVFCQDKKLCIVLSWRDLDSL